MPTYEVVVVPFEGDRLTVYAYQDGSHYLAIRGPCAALGLDYAREAAYLREEFASDCKEEFSGGETFLLLAKSKVAAWLYHLSPHDCLPQFQAELRRYRRRCQDAMTAVLESHFTGAVSPPMPPVAQDGGGTDVFGAMLAQNRIVGQMVSELRALQHRQELTDRRAEDARRFARDAVEQVRGYHGFCTIMGFWRTKGVRLTEAECNRISHPLARRCRRQGGEVRKLPHEKWGEVNSYPLEVLQAYFEEFDGTGRWWD